MGKQTGIAWCDHTFNPWWGCQRVSPGCVNCYAESLSRRLGYKDDPINPLHAPLWGPAKLTRHRTFGDKHWAEPISWDKQAAADGVRRRVFCASMADVFEDHPGIISDRTQLWSLIQATPNLDWLVLTKRPENIMAMIPPRWQEEAQPNVWYGTSVESDEYLGRLDYLRQVPAVVRFISYEPALGPVHWVDASGPTNHLEGIHWLIVGGESGPGARPFNVMWARMSIIHARFEGVAPFVKQLGAKPLDATGKPLRLKSYKGEDMAEWPDDIQVQEWPTPATIPPSTLALSR